MKIKAGCFGADRLLHNFRLQWKVSLSNGRMSRWCIHFPKVLSGVMIWKVIPPNKKKSFPHWSVSFSKVLSQMVIKYRIRCKKCKMIIASKDIILSKAWFPPRGNYRFNDHTLCQGKNHKFQLMWEILLYGDFGGTQLYSQLPETGTDSYRIECQRCGLIVASPP